MKIAVIGSRSFNDYVFLKDTLLKIISGISSDVTIVSGGAKGADILSEKFARENNLQTEIYLPDWKKFGRGAGIVRNKDIVNASDIVVAFWDGKSKGTLSSINIAKKQNKKIIEVLCE